MPAKRWAAFVVCAAAVALVASPMFAGDEAAQDDAEKMTRCTIVFDMKGWSALYKTMRGEGTISCDNGQAAAVTVKTTGGGLTAGKSELIDVQGTFSKVKDIRETFGAYAQAEAHAGAVGSSGAQALTKGEVSLALAGTGRGWDLGISFGKFTIRPKDEAAHGESPEREPEPPTMKAKEVDS